MKHKMLSRKEMLEFDKISGWQQYAKLRLDKEFAERYRFTTSVYSTVFHSAVLLIILVMNLL